MCISLSIEALRTFASREGDFWSNLSTEGRKVLGPYEQGRLGERLSLTNFDDDFLSPAEEESPRMVSFKVESTSFSCSLSTSIGHAIAKSRNDCSLEFSWVFLVDGTLSELGSYLSTFRIPVCSTFLGSQLVSLASNPHQIAIEILPALPCGTDHLFLSTSFWQILYFLYFLGNEYDSNLVERT